MANETHGFIRVPPDSTGKRLTHSVMLELTIGTITGEPSVGERFTFGTSTLSGTISKVETVGGTREMHLSLTAPIVDGQKPAIGDIFYENGVQLGLVSYIGELFYFPQSVLVGGTNNINSLEIQDDGAAWVSFANGSPEFDSFGKMQVSQANTIASYTAQYDTLSDVFTTVLMGTGSITHEPNTSGVIVSCGTDSGARVTRTSDLYHAYQPGVSQLLNFTGALGDQGKANVIRRAGLFDDNNGLFLEMNGTTFNVAIRSKSTGTIVETKVPSTEWNGDRMNGLGGVFNPSGIQLDPASDNIYWIDFQWLGAGTVRFGVFAHGKRVVIHKFHHTNASARSYMTTGSLPFRYEQINTGTSASTSEFRIFCATVQSEGAFTPRRILTSDYVSRSVTSATAVSVMAIRPTQLIGSIPNRGTVFMHNIQLFNHGADPMLVEVRRGSVSSDGSWVSSGTGSIVETNKTLTASTGGITSWSVIVPANSMVQVPINAYDEHRQGFRRKADISVSIEQVLTAKLLTGSTGGLLTATMTWDEVRA